MVEALHAADIEVLLDVVFNHTAESDDSVRRCAIGASTIPPTTAWSRKDLRRYIDTTGTHNSLKAWTRSRCD